MVVKKKVKKVVKEKVMKKKKAEEDEGMDLDNAFGDDEDVEYAESKPRKVKKSKEEELEEEVEEAEEDMNGLNEQASDEITHQVKASKPLGNIKKGDKVTIDGKQYEVDSHYMLMNHGSTKEMAIEMFDSKSDKDYQLRYFDDQVNETLELYELQEILYVKRQFVKISW